MGEPAAGGLGQGGCVGAAAQHVDLDSGGVREKGQVYWLGIWRTVWTVAFSRLDRTGAGRASQVGAQDRYCIDIDMIRARVGRLVGLSSPGEFCPRGP